MGNNMLVLTNHIYQMAEDDRLTDLARRIWRRFGRASELSDWFLRGTVWRELARERVRDRRDLWLEFQNRSKAAERQVVKLLWRTQRDDAWTALLAGAR